MANHSTAPDVYPLSKTWDEALAGENASGDAEKSTHYPDFTVPPAQDGRSTPDSNDTGTEAGTGEDPGDDDPEA